MSTCTGNASSTPHHDSCTPKGVTTARNTAAVTATRNATNPRCASTTCGTASGPAVIAKYVRCHLIIPMTG